jgi:AcrR family transcriptional regulator
MDEIMTPRTSTDRRLSREDWLAKAIDVLARQGSAKMGVDALADALGVTKGSFYWHFKDRSDFVEALLEYWLQAFTTNVIEKSKATCGSAEERLWELMQFLNDDRSGKFDIAIRAWAGREPGLDGLVRQADEERLVYLRSLFLEMGFQGPELEMRSQTFVIYHSFAEAISSIEKQSKVKREELLKRRHAFFTRK